MGRWRREGGLPCSSGRRWKFVRWRANPVDEGERWAKWGLVMEVRRPGASQVGAPYITLYYLTTFTTCV